MPGPPSSILLIADPGVPAAIAERLSDSLPSALTDCAVADGKWDVSVRRDSYPVDEHAEVLEVVRTIDPAGEPEYIVIYLTDLPRRLGTMPVIVDISLNNRFGLISIPAAGGVFIDRRVRNLAQTVVTELTCQSGKQHGSVKRLTRTQQDDVVRYVAPTALSRLHLLMGMVYANRPWRLAAGLSKGDDGGVRRWGREPGVSDNLAVVRHNGPLAVERGDDLGERSDDRVAHPRPQIMGTAAFGRRT